MGSEMCIRDRFRAAATWSEWFRSAGVNTGTTNRGLLINDYVLVIQAVMEGQGIALGWRHLTDPLVASGLLVRVTDHAMKTGDSFHVVWPKNRPLSENAQKVRDWLVEQA